MKCLCKEDPRWERGNKSLEKEVSKGDLEWARGPWVQPGPRCRVHTGGAYL